MKPQEAVFKEMDELAEDIVVELKARGFDVNEDATDVVKNHLDKWVGRRVRRYHWEQTYSTEEFSTLEKWLKANNITLKTYNENTFSASDIAYETGLNFHEVQKQLPNHTVGLMFYVLNFGEDWQKEVGYDPTNTTN